MAISDTATDITITEPPPFFLKKNRTYMEEEFHFFSHKNFRNIAVTLNHFCLIEIGVVIFFSYQAYDLLQWYKSIMTVDKFNGVAFWGAISGIVALCIGAVKYINDTHKRSLNGENK